jgi:uncharacterized protein (DUF362 family)
MIKLSYIKSEERRYNIERCLSLIKTEITSEIKNARKIVVKTSCLTENMQLGNTHADALFELLRFIKPHTNKQIILADGSAVGDTISSFKKFNFLKLQDQFDLTLADLNQDDFEVIELLGGSKETIKVKVSKTMLESDYIISLAPAKTHNLLNFCGGLYNSTIPAIAKYPARKGLFGKKELIDKFEQDKYAINQNVLTLSARLNIKLSILDCFELMQGNGPILGEMLPAHFAIASTNAFATDWLGAKITGFDLKEVDYLKQLDNQIDEDFFVVGDNWQKNILSISKPN